ncbi:hypothetical protein FE249_06940 [Acidiphilium multivorum]|uniref:DUF6508 domain-containing protein n=1 Tax=Acidiphilium multivorum TaxID=62140 RepID=UPI001F4C2CDE|nr:DUF6508 domain-containing protein [Acidiphilium multivorum]UNC13970.1 hypothetical protein FE249_06940 [Acidiphilium multivorum]
MSSDDPHHTQQDKSADDEFDADNIVERLEAIVRFLPIFEGRSFSFGEWMRANESSGVVTLPFFSESTQARDFVATAYRADWVYPFDWTEWVGTDEANRLRNDPACLAKANEQQLARLLTACIRADRFNEGALASDYESGLLTNILRRAAVLLADHKAT